MGVAQGIVEKAGAWYSYKGNKIGQGKDNTREYLRQNPALAVEIENLVRDKLGIKTRAVAKATASAPAEADTKDE